MEEDILTLKPRRIQNQNVVYRLEKRRVCSGRPGAHWYRVRCFHQNLFPNFTVVNVEKPPCFLRKFSPDGRYFIAFSSDQTSLEVGGDATFYPPNPPQTRVWIKTLLMWKFPVRYTSTKAVRQLRTCWEAKKERRSPQPTTSAPSTSGAACSSASSPCSTSPTLPQTGNTWTVSAASSRTTADTSSSARPSTSPTTRRRTSSR